VLSAEWACLLTHATVVRSMLTAACAHACVRCLACDPGRPSSHVARLRAGA